MDRDSYPDPVAEMALVKGRRASAPPTDAIARLTQLRRRRSYEEILELTGELLDDSDPAVAMAAHDARAMVAYEHADLDASRAHWEVAALLGGDDPWMHARALEAGYRGSESEGERDRIREELSHRELTADSAAARAAYLWALGRTLSGPNPDDRPPREDLEEAAHKFAQAWALDPTQPPTLGGMLRVKRLMVRETADRKSAVAEGREEVEKRRSEIRGANGELARVLRYEEARLELAAHNWVAARAAFDDVLRGDPGHQTANVWRMYVRRVTGELPRAQLVAGIDALLHDPERRTRGLTGQREDAPPGPIVSRDLVAELLTERASILEDGAGAALAQAAEDFATAASIRPRMKFAHRGHLRCLIRAGDFERAEDRERIIREEFGEQLPPDVLVDFGRLRVARASASDQPSEGRRWYAAAIRCYEKAIGEYPDYGPAYGGKLAAVRMSSGPEELRAELARTKAAAHDQGENLHLPSVVRVELGRAYLTLGEVDAALGAFGGCLEDASPQTLDHARAGVIDAHRVDRRMKEALRAANGALERGHGPRALGAAGWLHGELGNLQRSLDCYEEALVAHPLDLRLILGRARTLRLLGQHSRAAADLEAVRAELPPHSAVRIDVERGWIALEQGEHREAKALFRKRRLTGARRGLMVVESRSGASDGKIDAIADSALRTASGAGERAGLLLDIGRCRVERGDLSGAWKRFTAANAASSRSLLLRVSEAEALIAKGALADAKTAIDAACAIDRRYSRDPAVVAAIAWLRHATGDTDEAVALLGRLLEEWPDNEPARIRLALAMFANGSKRGACSELRELLDKSEGNAVAAELLARLLLARFERSRRGARAYRVLDEAKTWCRRARELEPRNPGAYRTSAWIAFHEGQTGQAELYLDQVAELRPGDPDVMRDRGALHLRLHRYESAEECLQKALDAGRRDPQVPFLLGALRLERDEPSAAIEYFRRAVALDPCSEAAHQALVQSLLRAKRPNDALQAADTALCVVPRGDRLQLYLMRARVLDSLAAAAQDEQREALVRQALRDVDRCESDDAGDTADIEYHRGVLEHRRGKTRAARAAFKAALHADPDHREALRAKEMLGQEGAGNPDDRRTRIAGWLVMAVAFLLLLGAITVGVLEADNREGMFDTRWLPAIAVLLVFCVVGAVLPRLAGLGFQGVVELTVAQPQVAAEPARVVLDFVDVPLLMMSGPGDYRPPDPIIDDAGDAIGG